MSATNSTANYELPIFLATDKPAWLTDWNGAMSAIDTAIHTAQAAADGAQTTASAATADISTINASLTTITGNITSLTTSVNSNTGAINTINSLIGNGEPTTTDKTLIGAINEIYGMITGGSNPIEADDVAYDNTTSGLTASNVQAAIDEIVAGSGVTVEADDVTFDNTASGLTASNVQAAIDEVVTMIPAAADVVVVTGTTPSTIPTSTWTKIADLPSGYTANNSALAGLSILSVSGGNVWLSMEGQEVAVSINSNNELQVYSGNVPGWLPDASFRAVIAKVSA